MKTVAGVFRSNSDAEQAAREIRAMNVPDADISILHPGATERDIEGKVPVSDTEGSGTATVLGGVVGASAGVASAPLLLTLLVPGVGAVTAIGMAAMGIVGAIAGAMAGKGLEESAAYELPHDEIYIYEDALRQGKTVLLTVVAEDKMHEVESKLEQLGAESVNRARDEWWLGIRAVEKEHYETIGGHNFEQNEPIYRKGFQEAQHPKFRGKSYGEVKGYLEERNPEHHAHESFSKGYERGQTYHQGWREKIKGDSSSNSNPNTSNTSSSDR